MSRTRGRPFEAGNTAGRGRPKGSRNKATLAREELFSEHGEAVIRKCLSMALKEDATAMRLCIERIYPVRRAMTVPFDMPTVEKVSDLLPAVNSVLRAVARGELTPAEGQQMVSLLESTGGMLTAHEFESRLRAIEDAIKSEEEKAALQRSLMCDEVESTQ